MGGSVSEWLVDWLVIDELAWRFAGWFGWICWSVGWLFFRLIG